MRGRLGLPVECDGHLQADKPLSAYVAQNRVSIGIQGVAPLLPMFGVPPALFMRRHITLGDRSERVYLCVRLGELCRLLGGDPGVDRSRRASEANWRASATPTNSNDPSPISRDLPSSMNRNNHDFPPPDDT